ncbi:MAG TPA: glycosyltransferase family 2 protein [Vicinamibacterales bacterium]|nr:glycosyltransferase family 2 protein [Vicinamibacterales bacterium]
MTVSLVTYNGLKWLPGCLRTLRAQTLQPLEVLVIDNASTDGTVGWLRAEAERDRRLVLSESSENLGFAKAHNRSIFRARGDFVCLLNQDIELDERFLEEATKPFALHGRIAAVQGRLRRLTPDGTRSSVLDSTGLVMYRDRRVVSRGQGEEDGPAHGAPGSVWGADGPAPVYRRAALLDARLPASTGSWEILDEDFFMYKEDVDLAWRLRLLKWEAWYTPSALAWHARGAGGTRASNIVGVIRAGRAIPRQVKILSWRNQRLMQVKNEELWGYVRDLPWIVLRELTSLGYMLVADPLRLISLPKFFRAAPHAFSKRRYLINEVVAKRPSAREANSQRRPLGDGL